MLRKLTAIAALAVLGIVPASAAASPAAGLSANDEIVTFDTASPGTISSRHALSGLAEGERLVGIDVRPATGQLHGFVVTPGAASNSGRLVTVDPGSGAVTSVGPSFSGLNKNVHWGFDFNPVVDRVRVVNSSGQNFRMNPTSGQLVSFDTNLTAGRAIVAIAYDENQPGASKATLWGYAYENDRIVRIGSIYGSPNSGNTGVVSDAGGDSGTHVTDPAVGFDIAPEGTGYVSGREAPPPGPWRLYKLNFTAAQLTSVGTFPEAVLDIAILPAAQLRFDGSALTVAEGDGAAKVKVVRTGDLSGTATVAYAASDGRAGGTLTFGPGVSEQTFEVPVPDDANDEPSEQLDLTLSAPAPGNASVGAPSSAKLTILDDDAPPVAPPPPDTSAPKLLLAAPSSLSVRKLARGVSGRFSCSEACSANFGLKLGKLTLGTAGAALTSGEVGSFRVKVSKKRLAAVRKKLRKRRAVTLRLTAAATDAAGNASGASARVVVTRR